MSEFVRASLGDRRVSALLIALLPLAALALTAVGIYGVVTFAAAQRTREMAVRAALGARDWQIAGLILGQGVRLAAAGIAIGAVASMWSAALLRARLYETSTSDPFAFSGAIVVLLITSIAASAAPAIRALRTPISRLLTG